jgi:hypothetical protein
MRILAILALLLIGGCVYLVSQRPHFSGSSPIAIDVRVSASYVTDTDTNEYRTSITNRAACDVILQEFRQAHWVFGSEKQMGTFTIQYDNGKADDVPVLHGFPHGYYSIIRPGGTYRMPIERFRSVLTNAGVDVSKFPGD